MNEENKRNFEKDKEYLKNFYLLISEDFLKIFNFEKWSIKLLKKIEIELKKQKIKNKTQIINFKNKLNSILNFIKITKLEIIYELELLNNNILNIEDYFWKNSEEFLISFKNKKIENINIFIYANKKKGNLFSSNIKDLILKINEYNSLNIKTDNKIFNETLICKDFSIYLIKYFVNNFYKYNDFYFYPSEKKQDKKNLIEFILSSNNFRNKYLKNDFKSNKNENDIKQNKEFWSFNSKINKFKLKSTRKFYFKDYWFKDIKNTIEFLFIFSDFDLINKFIGIIKKNFNNISNLYNYSDKEKIYYDESYYFLSDFNCKKIKEKLENLDNKLIDIKKILSFNEFKKNSKNGYKLSDKYKLKNGKQYNNSKKDFNLKILELLRIENFASLNNNLRTNLIYALNYQESILKNSKNYTIYQKQELDNIYKFNIEITKKINKNLFFINNYGDEKYFKGKNSIYIKIDNLIRHPRGLLWEDKLFFGKINFSKIDKNIGNFENSYDKPKYSLNFNKIFKRNFYNHFYQKIEKYSSKLEKNSLKIIFLIILLLNEYNELIKLNSNKAEEIYSKRNNFINEFYKLGERYFKRKNKEKIEVKYKFIEKDLKIIKDYYQLIKMFRSELPYKVIVK